MYEAAGIARPGPVPPGRGVHRADAAGSNTRTWPSRRCGGWSSRRCARVTRHNVVRQQSFSDRLIALMTRYTNQHLSAAQVIAELVAMAREVSADARPRPGSSLPR